MLCLVGYFENAISLSPLLLTCCTLMYVSYFDQHIVVYLNIICVHLACGQILAFLLTCFQNFPSYYSIMTPVRSSLMIQFIQSDLVQFIQSVQSSPVQQKRPKQGEQRNQYNFLLMVSKQVAGTTLCCKPQGEQLLLLTPNKKR